ncbi:class I SAM-dependent methyltransferase [Nakamurella leprariae]|uniref:Class I SAM-dependent methyltransferase n=1 Tax=Nakamurella leprariae TaxID=2803911 RepID=A0A939BY93_9ACTN|nr:class I SAM-dependent methyltransferase [Nakamurella leprariae]MBM9469328.1 class I SAM-dependent methyltransferase [Nakamurella leprariae]
MTAPATVGTPFHVGHADFEAWDRLLWTPMGRVAAEAVVTPGSRVLDACCGSGGSALPAAELTGPSGSVDALDLAPNLVALGRAKALSAGLTNIGFTVADVLAPASGGYDALVCCYGVFFFPDMDAGTRTLLGHLRPGGRFAILTWADQAMGTFMPLAMAAIGRHRPLPPASSTPPAERISTPDRFRAWLTDLDTTDIGIRRVDRTQPLTPDLAWSLVAGTALRGLLPDDVPTQQAIRNDLTAVLQQHGVQDICLDSLLAVGRVPSRS